MSYGDVIPDTSRARGCEDEDDHCWHPSRSQHLSNGCVDETCCHCGEGRCRSVPPPRIPEGHGPYCTERVSREMETQPGDTMDEQDTREAREARERAANVRIYYEALVDEGFTEEEALQLSTARLEGKT